MPFQELSMHIWSQYGIFLAGIWTYWFLLAQSYMLVPIYKYEFTFICPESQPNRTLAVPKHSFDSYVQIIPVCQR